MTRNRVIFIFLCVCSVFCILSCCPCRHLTAERRDSVRVVTRERTVERLVRDTVLVALPAQSERHTVCDTISRLENDLAASCARICPDGSLYHDLRTKPRLWPVPVDRREVETLRADTVYIDRARREVMEVPRPLTWWQQTQMRGFWVLLAALWAWLAVRRLRGLWK